MVAADLPEQVGADRVDDELGAFDRCGAVAGDVGRSGGDELSQLQLAVAVDRTAIRVGACYLLDEPTTGLVVDLDVPLPMMIPERNALSVNVSGPELGREAACSLAAVCWSWSERQNETGAVCHCGRLSAVSSPLSSDSSLTGSA